MEVGRQRDALIRNREPRPQDPAQNGALVENPVNPIWATERFGNRYPPVRRIQTPIATT